MTYGANMDPTGSVGATKEDISLDHWFKRPVLIHEFTWSELSFLNDKLYPWKSFFLDTPSIKNKLLGFSRLRAKLHLKFVINATPFQYGAALVSYRPLAKSVTDPSVEPFSGGSIGAAVSSESVLMAQSQRPSGFIYPQTCQGLEMTLPFIYPDSWFTLDNTDGDLAVRLECMGHVTVKSFTQLRDASTNASTTVSISVFAYAEDIELSGPSLQLQSGEDEYDAPGPVSSVATAVSVAAGALSNVPVIGPYARATSMISSVVASVARAFGYTNPPVLANYTPVTNSYMPAMANTQISTISEKLSLDPKNELTIDPSVIGYGRDDELVLKHYCSRSSYLFKTTWYPTDAAGFNLAGIYVTPELARVETQVGVSGTNQFFTSQMTPMAHAAQVFDNWTGGIKFQFKFICSRFHRGRVRITYDPSGPWTTTDPVLQINEVVDLASATDFTFVVPYMGAELWKEVTGDPVIVDARNFASVDQFMDRGDPTFPYRSRVCNGAIRLEVLNELTAPDVNHNIDILVFVSAADDFQLANPRSIGNRNASFYSPFQLQSGADEPDPDQSVIVDRSNAISSDINTVTMGEVALSIRDLFHRTILHSVYAHKSGVFSTQIIKNFIGNTFLPRFPRYPGVTTSGYNKVVATNGSTLAYNINAMTYMNWFTPSFVGWRGGVRWRLTRPEDSALQRCAIDTLAITRSPEPFTGSGTEVIYGADSYSDISNDYLRMHPTMAGTAFAVRSMGAVDATVPMYTHKRMFPANPELAAHPDLWSSDTDLANDNIRITVTGSTYLQYTEHLGLILASISGGVDFAPMAFVNVPTIYYTIGDLTPSPNDI